MVWVEGFEPPTSRSQAERPTKLAYSQIYWSEWLDLNQRSSLYQSAALACCATFRYWCAEKELNPHFVVRSHTVYPLAYRCILKQRVGVEPTNIGFADQFSTDENPSHKLPPSTLYIYYITDFLKSQFFATEIFLF